MILITAVGMYRELLAQVTSHWALIELVMSLPPTVIELCPDFDFVNDTMFVFNYYHTAEFTDGVFEDAGSPQHMRAKAFLILWIRDENRPGLNRCTFIHNGKYGELPRYQSGWHGFVNCYRTHQGLLQPGMVGFNWAGAGYDPRTLRLIRMAKQDFLFQGWLWARIKLPWCVCLRSRHHETDPNFWIRMGRTPCMTDPLLSSL